LTNKNHHLVTGASFGLVDDEREGKGDTDNSASKTMPLTLRVKLMSSFWNAIIQFVSDSTRSIDELIQIGRRLWPKFAAQLQPCQVCATMKSISKRLEIRFGQIYPDAENWANVEDEFVRVIGTRFYTTIANLTNHQAISDIPFTTVNEWGDVDSTANGHSFLRSCLLLAAFICQHNSASNDRKVFSSHGNGQRRKVDAIEDLYGGNEEDLAYGSTPKLRPFVLERVFSIFVTLVHLNPAAEEADDERFMDSLGSARLQADLSYLVGIGLLHPSKYTGIVNGEQINLGMARFTCSLLQEEAISIANRHGIPLEQYLL
jgi:Origin recognition complex (ORC) subunit 5 C-terminus